MIMVTGHKGFIGSHLCKRLEKENIPYVGYDIKDGDDIEIAHRLYSVMTENGVTEVVHLAALAGVRKGFFFPEDYIDTNIKGTYNVAVISKSVGVNHLIHFSSSSVYGNQKSPLMIRMPRVPVSFYGTTKATGEMIVEGMDIPYTIVRPFSVYGENGRKDQLIYIWLRQLKQGQPITMNGDGSMKRGYTYVGDVVNGVMALLRSSPLNATVNFGSPKSYSLWEVCDVFKKFFPKLRINFVGTTGEVDENVCGDALPIFQTDFPTKLEEIIRKELKL